ncbi:MAG: ABC transporter permease [Desulfobacteraceae bacterium]|jgi:hypothetical protein
MITNYIKTAFINIIRHRIYSLINIFGLAIGMACTIMIMLWVQDEVSYDKFHKNYNNLYRVLSDMEFSNGKETWAGTPYPLAASLKSNYPEIVEAARIRGPWPSTIMEVTYEDKRFDGPGCLNADPEIFSLFTFPFLEGDPGTALSKPDSIIITRKIAEKFFGKEDAIGKILKINNENDFIVTGVIENILLNSNLRFNFVIPVNNESPIWNNFQIGTYILIRNNTDANCLSRR